MSLFRSVLRRLCSDRSGPSYSRCGAPLLDLEPRLLLSAATMDLFQGHNRDNVDWSAPAVDVQGNLVVVTAFTGQIDPTLSASRDSFIDGRDDTAVAITKYDASDNLLWSKCFYSSDTIDFGALTTDSQGNILLTGAFYSTVDFNPDPNVENSLETSFLTPSTFVLKLGSDGSFGWVRGFMASSGGQVYSTAITVDAQDNLFATGSFIGTMTYSDHGVDRQVTSINSNDGYLMSLSPSGDMRWFYSVAGSANDVGTAVAVNSHGHIFFGGNFDGVFTVHVQGEDDPVSLSSVGAQSGFLLTFDGDGHVIEANQLNCTYMLVLSGLAVDAQDNVFATGQLWDSADFDLSAGTSVISTDSTSVFLAKWDDSWNLQFVVNSGDNSYMSIAGIMLTPQGNPLVVGTFTDTFDPNAAEPAGAGHEDLVAGDTTAFAVLYNAADGSLLRTSAPALADQGTVSWINPAMGAHGGAVWTQSYSVDDEVPASAAVFRYSDAGPVSAGTLGGIYLHNLELVISATYGDTAGNVYYAGVFTGSFDADPTAGVTMISSNSRNDVNGFIIKLDSSHHLVWAFSLATESFSQIASITADADGNLLIGGAVMGEVDFDLSDASFLLGQSHESSAFIWSLTPDGQFHNAHLIADSEYYACTQIAVDHAGNLIALTSMSEFGDRDTPPTEPPVLTQAASAFLYKFDADANMIWRKELVAGGQTSPSLVLNAAGDIFICGSFSGPLTLVPEGQDPIEAAGDRDLYLARIDSDGRVLLTRTLSAVDQGDGSEIDALALVIDSQGRLYLTGFYQGEMDVDFSPDASTTLLSQGTASFVAAYTPDFSLLWAKNFTSTTNQAVVISIGLDGRNNFYVSGYYAGAMTLSDSVTLTMPEGGEPIEDPADYFVALYDTDGNLQSATDYMTTSSTVVNQVLLVLPHQLSFVRNGSILLPGSIAGPADFHIPGVTDFTAYAFSGYVLWYSQNGGSLTVDVDGRSVSNGQSTPVSFPTASLGQLDSATRILTLTNASEAVLTFTGLSLPRGYHVVAMPPLTLEAGASASLVLRLDAKAAGDFAGDLLIAYTIDGQPGTFSLPLSGGVVAPTVPDAQPGTFYNYIYRLYLDVLLRTPDAAGLAYWTNQLDSGAMSRDQIAGFFIECNEHRTLEVTGLYHSILGRAPDDVGFTYWMALYNGGSSLEQITAAFYGSDEYLTHFGSAVEASVYGFYLNLLDRSPDTEGSTSWLSQLDSQSLSREQTALGFLRSPEYHNVLANSLYQRYLHREADDNGVTAWINSLDAGATIHSILQGFLASQEYYSM